MKQNRDSHGAVTARHDRVAAGVSPADLPLPNPPARPFQIVPLCERFGLMGPNCQIWHTSWTKTGPLEKHRAELTRCYQEGWLAGALAASKQESEGERAKDEAA